MARTRGIRSITAVLALAAPACAVHADHPSVGLGTGVSGPVTALSAVPLSRGAFSAGLRLEYQALDAIGDARLSALSEAHQHAHSTDALWHASLIGGYGVTRDLSLGLSLPYVRRTGIREPAHIHDGPDEVVALGDSEGVGDLRLYAQYRFAGGPAQARHSALIVGVKAPTGEEHERTRGGAGHHGGDGEFGTEHQPGSGSWDPFVGLAHSRVAGAWSLHASLLYTVATEGSRDTDLGDSLHYDLAAVRRLGGESHHHDDGSTHVHHQGRVAWHAIVELNGEYHQRETVAGEKVPNSGGDFIFLSPGIRATLDNRWAATLAAGFPVVSNPNGVHSEPELRLIASVAAGF